MRFEFKNTHHPLIKNVFEVFRIIVFIFFLSTIGYVFFLNECKDLLFFIIMGSCSLYVCIFNFFVNICDRWIVRAVIIRNGVYFNTLFGRKLKFPTRAICEIKSIDMDFLMQRSKAFQDNEMGFEIVLKNYHPLYITMGMENVEKLREILTEIAESNRKSGKVNVNNCALEKGAVLDA